MVHEEARSLLAELRNDLASALLGLSEEHRLHNITERQIEALSVAIEVIESESVTTTTCLAAGTNLNVLRPGYYLVDENSRIIELTTATPATAVDDLVADVVHANIANTTTGAPAASTIGAITGTFTPADFEREWAWRNLPF